MSKDLQVQAVEVDKAVKRAVGKLADLATSTLKTYHYIGKQVSELRKDYGGKVVEQFAEKLSEQLGNAEISPSTLYRCRKFYENYRKIDLFIDAGVSWTQVTQSLGAPKDEVERILNKIIEGQVKSTELSKYASSTPLVEEDDESESPIESSEDEDPGEGYEWGYEYEYEEGEESTPDPEPLDQDKEPKERKKKGTKRAKATKDDASSAPEESPAGVIKDFDRCENYIDALCDKLGGTFLAVKYLEKFNPEEREQCREAIASLQKAFTRLKETGGAVNSVISSLKV